MNNSLMAGITVALLAGSTALADLPNAMTQGVFTDVFGSSSYFSDGPASGGGGFFHTSDITGLKKFDSSLGTLTNVTIDAPFDWDYSIDIFAGDVPDFNADHEIGVVVPDLHLFIGYTPGGGTSTVVLGDVAPAPSANCFAFADEGPCQDGFFDGGTGGRLALWSRH